MQEAGGTRGGRGRPCLPPQGGREPAGSAGSAGADAKGRRVRRTGGGDALTEEQQHVPGTRPVPATDDQGQQQQPAGRPSAVHGGRSGPAPPRSRARPPRPRGHARARSRPGGSRALRAPPPLSSLPLPLRFLRTPLRRRLETPSCGAG